MPFSPNTGYAFAVAGNTWHSADLVGPEVKTRDSILLTYFVDTGPWRFVRNRGRRLANFVLNEFRNLKRNQVETPLCGVRSAQRGDPAIIAAVAAPWSLAHT